MEASGIGASSPMAEEGYCNEASQSGPLTHSQSMPPSQKYSGTYRDKTKKAWTREEIREVIWCYVYCRQHFTEIQRM